MRLEHTRHPLAIDANAAGRVEGSHAMQRMLLVLAPPAKQEAQLEQLVNDQQNRKSRNYHHWLIPAQFGAQFGAADADVQSAVSWLQNAGFTVGRIAAGKRWIEFSGTSAQVENAFHTVMQYYRVDGKTSVANSTDLSIPVALSGIVRGVVSLNSFGRTAPVHPVRGTVGRIAQGRKTVLGANLIASGGSTNTYYVAPGDFAAIYNTSGLLKSGIDGTGISIAVTAQSDIELTDVQEFRQIFALKDNDPNFLWSGPDPGVTTATDAQEALLDVEWAGAVAPGATINLVIAGSTDTTSGVDLAAAYAIDNEVAPIVSYTYGSCEQALGPAGNTFYSALWEQAAAEGITVLVASGDNGAAGCDSASTGMAATQGLAVNGVASTPYNVAVGGTEFADAGQQTTYWGENNSAVHLSAMGYISEAAWNESCDPSQPASTANCVLDKGNFTLLASGGGASTLYGKPAWQTGTGVLADSARDLPDVALAGATDHDEEVYCTSLAGTPCQMNAEQEVVGLTPVGGSSVSTAALAGILALIEQKNGALQGQVNYVLYPLAQVVGNSCNSSNETNPTAQNACVFYDVTTGNNEVPCAGGSPGCSSAQNGVDGFTTGQVAGVGYDLVTGLGSVNATNLALAWKNATLLASPTSAPLQAGAPSFTLNVSPNPIAFVAGSPGNGTVTITPSAGFTGTVAVTCATGGTTAPTGYTCNFGQSNVPVNNAVATTSITFAFSSTSSATSAEKVVAVRAGRESGDQRRKVAATGWDFAAGLLSLCLVGLALGGGRKGRNYLLAAGLVVGVTAVVWSCGGGSGGGQFSTTTTIVSNSIKAPFGTPVTFTVTVKPNGAATPSGLVQLYDNGQAFLGPVNVSVGVATFLAGSLPIGVHNLSASYLGDAHTLPSQSAPIQQAITGQTSVQMTGISGGLTQTLTVNISVI